MKTFTLNFSANFKTILFSIFTLIAFLQTPAIGGTTAENGWGCYKNWKLKIYERPHFNGDYKCFLKGEYYAGRHCRSDYGRGFSIKVREGYIVCFYDRRGRLIKKVDCHEKYIKFRFYKFVVKKVYHEGGHGGQEEVVCYKDWTFKVFDNPHYRGEYVCFRKGTYYIGKDCRNYWGKKISFKVRKGYIVCFYNRKGRLVGKIDHNDDYFVCNFYKFVIKKVRYEDDHDEVVCYRDWKFQIYDNAHYRGEYVCFRKGCYYVGKDCGNYWGRKISFKVKKGYIVCFYDKRGRLIKKADCHDDYFVGNFYKFVVKKARYQYAG